MVLTDGFRFLFWADNHNGSDWSFPCSELLLAISTSDFRIYFKFDNGLHVVMYIVYPVDADGAGGKGTWGKLLDTDVESHIDRNDPNYDSGEVKSFSLFCW